MSQIFQVNLRGIIELLSNHLYSGPDVFVRELLQNGVDALAVRKELDGSSGGIRVHVRRGDGAPEIVFEDDGVGLTEDEVHQFLATLGESSKRRVDASGAAIESDLIGQFGIGLLACFLVSDEIVVRTKSARDRDAPPIEWRGRQDGTYDVKRLEPNAREAGTTVLLRARSDRLEWYDASRLRDLLTHYGSALAWPIELVEGDARVRINPEPLPWKRKFDRRSDLDDAVLAYGRATFGIAFADWIPLRASTSGTDGVAYVLPFAPNLTEHRRHRVYLKGMLVSDRSTELVPEWAFFVHCILDSQRLRPTASREALYEDERLDSTREELGAGIRAWLLHIAKNDPQRLLSLISVHHRAIKALASQDDDVLELFAQHLPFETTSGMLAFSEIVTAVNRGPIQYAASVDAFRQMAPVARAQGKTLVNAGYAYDADVLVRAASLENVPCELLEATALTEDLDDLTPRETALTESFLLEAKRALERFGCDVSLKSFRPEELPAFYAASGEVDRRHDVERTREQSSGLWSDVLGALESGRPRSLDRPLLCLNYRSALVRRLASIDGEGALDHALSLLYVHALLLGHRPLRSLEHQILPSAILGFIEWGLDARGAGTLQ